MIIAIVAHDEYYGIGKDGKIPWKCLEDLKLFKQITYGHKIVMGRKTWESLPSKPLPGRTNIVITNQKNYDAPGAIISDDIVWPDDDIDNLFVIGGSSVYEMYIPYLDAIYMTKIKGNYNCDIKFPSLNGVEFISTMPAISLSKNATLTFYNKRIK
jgi:dihydrofolate reductase